MGMVTNNGNGTFSYDPNGAFASLKAGATATDTFHYTVTDGAGVSSTATVTITSPARTMPGGGNFTARCAGARAGDDGHGVLYRSGHRRQPQLRGSTSRPTRTKGKVTDNGNGTFSYDPNGAFASLKAGATATDTFHYTVTDGSGAVVDGDGDHHHHRPERGAGHHVARSGRDGHRRRRRTGKQNGSESTSGSITFTDADVGDVHTASVAAQGSGYVGELTLDTSKHDTGGGGASAGSSRFPNSAIEHLAGARRSSRNTS